jgi:hypothetical protein
VNPSEPSSSSVTCSPDDNSVRLVRQRFRTRCAANNPPQIVRSRLSNIIPCSGPAKQRHKIIGNRLALVGEESVSGVTAEPRRVNQEHPLMRVYIIGNYAVPHGAGDTQ